MNKTSADATRLTAPPALHWARDRRALHPRRHGTTQTFEGFFFLVATLRGSRWRQEKVDHFAATLKQAMVGSAGEAGAEWAE